MLLICRALSCSVLVSVGCTAVQRDFAVSELEGSPLRAEVGVIKFANVGSTIFASGQVAKRKSLRMSQGVSGTMYGPTSFDFSIEPCDLVHVFDTPSFEYYGAPQSKVTATRIFGSGDVVGLRVHKKDRANMLWFAESSYAISADPPFWHCAFDGSAGLELKLTKSIDVEDPRNSYVSVVLDGFYNALVHFTLQESRGPTRQAKEFHFNLDPGHPPTRIGIKGMLLDIMDIDNVGMHYRWVEFPR